MTAEGLERYLHESLSASLDLKKTTQTKKLLETLSALNLSAHARERVAEELKVHRLKDVLTPSLEDVEKVEKLADQMNSRELQEVFQGRVRRLMALVAADRKLEAASPAKKKAPTKPTNLNYTTDQSSANTSLLDKTITS